MRIRLDGFVTDAILLAYVSIGRPDKLGQKNKRIVEEDVEAHV